MSRIKALLLFLVPLCTVSCVKVIELRIHDSDRRYVIEGIITNEPGVCKVRVTRTSAFYEINDFEPVTDAVVQVRDNGVANVLIETRPGVYEIQAINGTPGHQYELSVLVNNLHFFASCTMPEPVNIDTAYISPGPFNRFFFLTVGYSDPHEAKNHYRFVQFLNGVQDPAIFVDNDEFSNGRSIVRQLDTGVDRKDDLRAIESGDLVTLQMLGLSEEIYNYWYSVRSGGTDGSPGSAAPANPLTNITGGALGYFSAQTVDQRMVIAP